MPFDAAEYAERLRDTKTRMEHYEVDVIVLTDPSNMCYLTGYDGWSFYVPQCLVVALDADEPIWIGRGMDANAAKVTTSLSHENILPYADDYVQSTEKHALEFVAEIIAERGWGAKVVGIEADGYYLSPRGAGSLRAGLPDARITDITGLVNWVRSIKSPAEIAVMRQAARILEHVMEAGVEAVRPGVRQCDAAAAILKAATEGTPEFGGDYTAIVPMLPSGKGTSTPHLTWSDAVFNQGEATILELAGCRTRYHTPMARTVFLGDPPQKMLDVAQVVVEGLNNALEAVKPGVTCEQVEGVWRDTIAKHGIVKDSRIGYSIGLSYPPDWGERTMSLRPGDETEIHPNMTFHMIPGVWMDDWGIEISEPFLVTETGAEPFASFERGLLVR